ncbi:P-type conjugative transfer protein TrbJ [Hoeflea poritis]|uniref:P-type conjugative transfer protein TrbJ n=1 Tax=Hoeflea poritis TaxID=2993659 RepID=A0ABT4VV73_9HYPH|nr:P-type conjugative transfer protein TrbJ [Hoeflea poritis]MDA4848605.1 P-type conjugative transfer protein TrbJ [Hoeflea poritis]
MRIRFLAAVTAVCLTIAPVDNAYALFGFGDIVYDPTNHAENLLTAARSLEQINNQVRQLANEAQMLINQAQNLASLPSSIASELQTSLEEVGALIENAEGLAYDVVRIDEAYRELFPEGYAASVTTSRIVQDAQATWELAREGFKHSLDVQAGVVVQLQGDAATLDGLIADSQGAAGNLQALQAGNQLTALAAKQSMQLQSLLAASARADALREADALAARERGRARFERFLGDGNAYSR